MCSNSIGFLSSCFAATEWERDLCFNVFYLSSSTLLFITALANCIHYLEIHSLFPFLCLLISVFRLSFNCTLADSKNEPQTNWSTIQFVCSGFYFSFWWLLAYLIASLSVRDNNDAVNDNDDDDDGGDGDAIRTIAFYYLSVQTRKNIMHYQLKIWCRQSYCWREMGKLYLALVLRKNYWLILFFGNSCFFTVSSQSDQFLG